MTVVGSVIAVTLLLWTSLLYVPEVGHLSTHRTTLEERRAASG
jgi:hypothetical protein